MKQLIIFLATIITPTIASAHVKWFVDTDAVIASQHGSVPFYTWGSREVFIWSAIVFAIVLLFSVVDKVVPTPKRLLAFAFKHEWGINRIAQAVLGVFLVMASLVWKVVLVPNLPVQDTVTTILQGLQLVVGIMFITNVMPRIASMLLVGFCVGLGIKLGFVALLENAILLSLAVYFFIVSSKSGSFTYAHFHKHAVEIVRIGTGISLITLAFTEKLLYPELSLQFLSVHDWNFMQGFFPWFTDNLFVLSTGFAELIFGILFLMGYITRITTVLIAIFFGLSVTTMLIQFNAWEVEDLVVYAAAILFVFFGHGRTKFFHFSWAKKKVL